MIADAAPSVGDCDEAFEGEPPSKERLIAWDGSCRMSTGVAFNGDLSVDRPESCDVVASDAAASLDDCNEPFKGKLLEWPLERPLLDCDCFCPVSTGEAFGFDLFFDVANCCVDSAEVFRNGRLGIATCPCCFAMKCCRTKAQSHLSGVCSKPRPKIAGSFIDDVLRTILNQWTDTLWCGKVAPLFSGQHL